MYAVIITGGKQYKVKEGDVLEIELLDSEAGDKVEFDQVLLLANDKDVKVGAPLLDGAKVTAEVVENGRAKKIQIIKFKRRKHHMKQMGHRQYFTKVKIVEIKAA